MTTPMQMQSNRRNAQQSTGPRTEAGKAISSRNAARHGYYASDVVMAGEDGEQFARLQARVEADWLPETDDERELTDEIAAGLWRRRRLRRAEAGLWTELQALDSESPLTLGQAFARDSASTANALEKHRRWWQSNERQLNRCENQLALRKRLAAAGRRAPPAEVLAQRRQAARETDLYVNAPMPDAMAGIVDRANEIRGSMGPTQSVDSERNEQVGPAAVSPATPASHPAPALSRKERRARERKQAKEQRRQAKAIGARAA